MRAVQSNPHLHPLLGPPRTQSSLLLFSTNSRAQGSPSQRQLRENQQVHATQTRRELPLTTEHLVSREIPRSCHNAPARRSCCPVIKLELTADRWGASLPTPQPRPSCASAYLHLCLRHLSGCPSLPCPDVVRLLPPPELRFLLPAPVSTSSPPEGHPPPPPPASAGHPCL